VHAGVLEIEDEEDDRDDPLPLLTDDPVPLDRELLDSEDPVPLESDDDNNDELVALEVDDEESEEPVFDATYVLYKSLVIFVSNVP